MSTLKEKIENYINPKGLIKTPAHYAKEILSDIVNKIDESVNKLNKTIDKSIEEINLTVNTTINQNIIPYVQNKIVFNTEELNIDTKNGYYYNDNLLENLKITKSGDTICPKVEFHGYCIKLELPKEVTLKDELVDFSGISTYILNFDNDICKIDRYEWDLSGYFVATYSEGTTNLSYNNLNLFASLDRKYLNKVGPVYENERLITSPNGTAINLLFRDCTGLTSIKIPNSITSIGLYAFSNCTGLTSIEIPNSVTYISFYAFEGCTGLTSIEIPNSVTSISASVFSNCTELTSVTMTSTIPPSLGPNVFSSTHSNLIIYVPDESVDAYKTATNWMIVADKIKPLSEKIV